MKKIACLLSALAFAVGAYAQGTVNVANAGSGWSAPIFIGNVGGTLAGNTITVEVLAGPDANSLVAVGAPFNIAVNGLFAPGVRNINNVNPGSTATVLVRAWDSLTGASFAAATTKGQSALFTAPTGGGPSPAPPPGTFVNMQSFAVVVPEPSVIALAILGAGALLFSRRKR